MFMALGALNADASLIASHIFGWLSIGSWLVVYSPQLYENYALQSGEGLSVAFVIAWLAGDVFNLVGGILAGLLPTIIILAAYYTLCDTILLIQVYYYRWKTQRKEKDVASEQTPLLNSESTQVLSPVVQRSSLWRDTVKYALLWAFVLAFGIIAFFYDRSHGDGPSDGPPPPSEDIFEWKSQVLGWLSAILYLGSRIPQIAKNIETRCEGLSLALFMFAIAGNVFYVLSICVVSMEWNYIATNASWLAGSGLTVLLDILVIGQFLYFRTQDRKAVPESTVP